MRYWSFTRILCRPFWSPFSDSRRYPGTAARSPRLAAASTLASLRRIARHRSLAKRRASLVSRPSKIACVASSSNDRITIRYYAFRTNVVKTRSFSRELPIEQWKVTLQVDRQWKGVASPRMVIDTALDDGMCGPPRDLRTSIIDHSIIDLKIGKSPPSRPRGSAASRRCRSSRTSPERPARRSRAGP